MMYQGSLNAVAIALLTFSGSANAFWRMPCRARSGLARVDPLTNNGSISEHAHAIHGSSGFSTTAGYDALTSGSCTSCEVAEDKSAYWTPAVYFKSASTGKYTLVEQVGGMLAYYLLYPNAGNTSLSAFPVDFEMIAGDTNQRNFTYPVPDIEKSAWGVAPYNTQPFLRQAALGFNCLNYAKTPEGSLYRHFMPDKAYLDANCADGVRFELMFPSCWNGKDSTSPDKKSHVAYPSQVMTGECPDGFKERLPSLFYETIWNTYEFKGQDGEFYLSNGDPTGYGYHGDFMMGWNQPFLQAAVNKCTNLSGQIQDCPLFTIQDESVFSNCDIKLPSAIAKEDTSGPIATMPGNPAIQPGPAYASDHAAPQGKTTTTASLVAAPTLSYSAGISLASSDTYVPGGIFAVSTQATYAAAEAVATSSAEPAVAAAKVDITSAPSAPAPTDTASYIRTEYSTSGNEVYEVLWVETEVTITASETTTIYASASAAAERKRHFHKHRRGSGVVRY